MSKPLEPFQGWDNIKRPVSPGYAPALVRTCCVQDEDWQRFRQALKGLPTHEKLRRLEVWWDQNPSSRTEVQVGNYLGALRRGGQLNAHNQIKRLM